MPVFIDPRPGAAPRAHSARSSSESAAGGRHALRIGLLNNMPDSALEGTQSQFTQLLQRAAQDQRIELRLSSLPELDRSSAARQHMERAYWPLGALLSEPLDGLIVTGTEPRAPQLRDEPYWRSLTEVIDWAQSNTVSTIWSCLAAHAVVQHLDGIARRRLPEKCCGVFEHRIAMDHPLIRQLTRPVHTPHSRWNELPAQQLTAAGYEIITDSAQCGVNLFIRQRGSLFVFVQGHPEYEAGSLLKEYRRDVGRFLKAEHSRYPALPQGYFSSEMREWLGAFEELAKASPRPELLEAFPFAACAAGLQDTWSTGAGQLYRNWLAVAAGQHSR